jgi:hypothetical protein
MKRGFLLMLLVGLACGWLAVHAMNSAASPEPKSPLKDQGPAAPGIYSRRNRRVNRKPFLTAGALFMGLIMVLGAIGIVNGLWSKNLVINGVVETGDLNADWDCGYTNDDGAVAVIPGGGCPTTILEPAGDAGADPNNFDWPNFTDSSPFVYKDVGECELAIGDTDVEFGFGDQVAYVTITNAYPSYECTITLFLTNTGSIPFNIVGASLTLAPSAVGNIETIDDAGVNQCDPSALDAVQVDPGEEEEFVCTVHVTQTADQSVCTGTTGEGVDDSDAAVFPVVTETCTTTVSYEFAINVCVAQWNEDATFDECKNSLQHEGPDEVVFD